MSQAFGDVRGQPLGALQFDARTERLAAQRQAVALVAEEGEERLPARARREACEPGAAQILRHGLALARANERADLIVQRRRNFDARSDQRLPQPRSLQIGVEHIATQRCAVRGRYGRRSLGHPRDGHLKLGARRSERIFRSGGAGGDGAQQRERSGQSASQGTYPCG